MAKYEMKYMYDWASGSCLWATNDAARKRYGCPVRTEDLPISSDLKSRLDFLIEKHDEALNWDCPQDDLLWSEEQIKSFKADTIAAYKLLCEELGGNYAISLWENCPI